MFGEHAFPSLSEKQQPPVEHRSIWGLRALLLREDVPAASMGSWGSEPGASAGATLVFSGSLASVPAKDHKAGSRSRLNNAVLTMRLLLTVPMEAMNIKSSNLHTPARTAQKQVFPV